MQLSSLIGKKLISPAGEQLGYVTGAYLSRDLRSLSALAAADGEEEEFILPINAVKANADAIIATRRRIPSAVGVPAPIGRKAFSEKGEDLGVVSDWLFGDCEPAFLVIKDGIKTGYAAEKVVSESHVVVYLTGNRPAPKKRAKKNSESLGTKNRATMSEETPAENVSAPPSQAPEERAVLHEKEPAPPLESAGTEQTKFELGSRNLLGKRVVRSVFDAHGEIIALAGDRITPEVLSRARRKGRLLALTVNTLTNVY